jgi:hypothetical protein
MPNINDPAPPFVLSDGEKQSPLWKRLEQYFTDKRDECRAKNDGALDPIATANMRGRIQTYRDLLALGKE